MTNITEKGRLTKYAEIYVTRQFFEAFGFQGHFFEKIDRYSRGKSVYQISSLLFSYGYGSVKDKHTNTQADRQISHNDRNYTTGCVAHVDLNREY